MEKMNVIKIVGLAATGLGLVATIVSNWASQKQMDATITEKVAEAIANTTNTNGES